MEETVNLTSEEIQILRDYIEDGGWCATETNSDIADAAYGVIESVVARCLREEAPAHIQAKDQARKAAKILAPVFYANKWQWAGIGIPTEQDLYEHMLDQLMAVLDDDTIVCVGSGRTAATKAEGTVELSLSLGHVYL